MAHEFNATVGASAQGPVARCVRECPRSEKGRVLSAVDERRVLDDGKVAACQPGDGRAHGAQLVLLLDFGELD